MTDPTALQAALDANEDIRRDERRRMAQENAALRVELAAANAALDEFRRATTMPAPPMSEAV